jgi:phosphate-selective porin OprO/OprP
VASADSSDVRICAPEVWAVTSTSDSSDTMQQRPFTSNRLLRLTGIVIDVMVLCSCGVGLGGEPPGAFEDLQRQIDRQEQRIQQLESLRTDEQETLPDLSGTSDVGGMSDAATESRLDRLEESVFGLESLDGRFLEALSNYSRRIVNGRIHIDQWGFPQDSAGINTIETGDPNGDPQDRLLYRRIRLGVRGTVPPENMPYRMEIEFSGQDGSQFRDAWIGWDELLLLNTLRIGNQKRPYGLDHLNSSNFNVFLERPFVVDGFNEDNRRFGLVSYGVTDDMAFNWRYGLYDLELIQNSGSTINDEYQLEFGWRLANTWWYDEACDGRCFGHWGLSGTFAFPDGNAPNNGIQNNEAQFRTRPEGRSNSRWLDTRRIAGAESYQILGIESVVNLGCFQFAGEFMNLWLQRNSASGSDIYLYGGYFYLSWFLTGEHIPWNRQLGILGRVEPFTGFFCVDAHRERGLGAWQFAARLSYADFNDRDILGGIGNSVTFALNWHWNSHARMQFNYVIGRIDDRLADLAGGGTAVVSGDYQISGVRFMLDF